MERGCVLIALGGGIVMMASHGPVVSLKNDRWLTVDLVSRHTLIGWPVVGPAIGQGRQITWLQVKDRDLPPTIDPADYYQTMAKRDAISTDRGLLTAADISRYAWAAQGGAWALCTAGLSNGETVRLRTAEQHRVKSPIGTVNLLAISPQPLSLAASLEALSIIAEARTDAILSCELITPDGHPISGTGTDCIILAVPCCAEVSGERTHCGLHTDWGRALAAATFQACQEACRRWVNPWQP
jgi:adenosylcobinamide amidohydrolase